MVLSVAEQRIKRASFAWPLAKNKADKLCLPAPERWDYQNRLSKIPLESVARLHDKAKLSHCGTNLK
jgi:hypothetical protein